MMLTGDWDNETLAIKKSKKTVEQQIQEQLLPLGQDSLFPTYLHR